MATAAIIPARGGSKRIPLKNIHSLNGKPMIAWTIEAAIESKMFDDVYVATDNEEIAKIAKQYGAKVPHLRTLEDADDHTPSSVVTANFLGKLDKKYDTVVQLMPNCPCKTANDIIEAIEHFKKSGAQFQLSVFKFGWMNPWWAMKMNADQTPAPLFPEALKTRSQDLENLYCPTGAIWVANAEMLLKHKTFYGPGHKLFPLEWMSAVDVDDYEDLKMAELVLKMRD